MRFYMFTKPFLKVFSSIFYPIKVHGDTEPPQSGAVIICANHLSLMDAVLMALVIKRPIHFLGKAKYADNFFLKPIFRAVHAISVDTDKMDIGAIKTCFRYLREGGVLGIFPEGTRIRNGIISEAKAGTIMMAHKTKTPIFYMRIKPSKGRLRVFRRTDIYLGGTVTAEQLGVNSKSNEYYIKGAAELMSKIYSLGEE